MARPELIKIVRSPRAYTERGGGGEPEPGNVVATGISPPCENPHLDKFLYTPLKSTILDFHKLKFCLKQMIVSFKECFN